MIDFSPLLTNVSMSLTQYKFRFVLLIENLGMEYTIGSYKSIVGKVCTTLDGFKFISSKMNEKYRYLKCAMFRSGCKGTARLNRETNLITPLHEHDHDVEDYKSDVFNLKTKCKTIATKVKQILDKFLMMRLEMIHALVKLLSLSVNQQCIVLDERLKLKFPYQHLNSVK